MNEQGKLNGNEDNESDEVKLPLKDVLNLVTLVANLECQTQGDNPSDDLSLYSTIHSMVSLDAKFPKLKEHFKNLHDMRNISEKPHCAQKDGYQPVCSRPPQEEGCAWRPQKRASVLDVFIDENIMREYVELGEEGRKDKGEGGSDSEDVTLGTEELCITEYDEDATSNDNSKALSIEAEYDFSDADGDELNEKIP